MDRDGVIREFADGEDRESLARLFAERELEIIGLLNQDLGQAVLQLIEVFQEQGHSGASAAAVVGLFVRLAMFRPLSPLTGDAAEWRSIGGGVEQNRRCSSVFRDAGGAYDVRGRVFREPSGVTYTSRGSRVSVTFPYEPLSVVVDVQPCSRDEVAEAE